MWLQIEKSNILKIAIWNSREHFFSFVVWFNIDLLGLLKMVLKSALEIVLKPALDENLHIESDKLVCLELLMWYVFPRGFLTSLQHSLWHYQKIVIDFYEMKGVTVALYCASQCSCLLKKSIHLYKNSNAFSKQFFSHSI